LFAAAPTALRGDPPYLGLRPPSDTTSALQNISLSPARNVRQVCALVPSRPPYLPVLASPPREFMIALNFAGGGLKHPAGIAVDRIGKTAWIANEGGNSVVELSASPDNLGAALSPPAGFTGAGLSAPTAIQVVPNRGAAGPSIWVTNRGSDSLTLFTLPARGQSGLPRLTQIIGNGLSAPIDLMDGAVANSGSDKISLFKSNDGEPCGQPVAIPGLKHAAGIGSAGNRIWVADYASNTLFEVNRPPFGCAAQLLRTITSHELSKPHSIAYGMESGTITVTNSGNNSIAVFDYDSAGVPKEIQGSPFTGGGLSGPAGVVIDGDANAWVANNAPGANSISEIGHVTKMFAHTGMPLSPDAGFDGPALARPFGIAIDGDGDVWVTNPDSNSVTVFFGVAVAPF
jgi:hypothetical protein